jgi:hypothetical protein
MLKRMFVALSVATMALAGLTAQENATFTLRSGERISGQLVDMGGSGFAIRVNGQDRQIPTGEMALIDFSNSSMSQADWDRVSGEHVLWLRNGESLTGELMDVGGTAPLRISFRTGNGERTLSSNEVSRIALGRPSNVGSGSGSSGGGSGSGITVSSRQPWTPTGITVRRGEQLSFTAEGEIRISGNSDDVASPSGVRVQRFEPRSPMPQVLAGALIGRIGNSAPFGIGTQGTFPAPASGQLFLGINDANFSDNDGEFRVQVSRSGLIRR